MNIYLCDQNKNNPYYKDETSIHMKIIGLLIYVTDYPFWIYYCLLKNVVMSRKNQDLYITFKYEITCVNYLYVSQKPFPENVGLYS